ncbi:hypothetical protein PHMEG_00031804 [Phytophthora megakarya]|uniref:Uncharacterized protein n=1 Tax=Phytophthora megakarya TaxID=4795 RepID=A0A225UXF9_9STRA|nr:hypothetical protein PHMEG_00031804 [Phytophthora megakarya]
MSPPVSSESHNLVPCICRCRSKSEPLKSERIVWSGMCTTFQDEKLQRRTHDKIQQLMEDVHASNNDTNALIAMKVLKYRKLSEHAATRCV